MKHEIIVKDPIVYESTKWEDIPDQDKVKNSVLILPQSYKEKVHVSDIKWEVLFYNGRQAKYLGLFWDKKHAIWFADTLITKFVSGREI